MRLDFWVVLVWEVWWFHGGVGGHVLVREFVVTS